MKHGDNGVQVALPVFYQSTNTSTKIKKKGQTLRVEVFQPIKWQAVKKKANSHTAKANKENQNTHTSITNTYSKTKNNTKSSSKTLLNKHIFCAHSYF